MLNKKTPVVSFSCPSCSSLHQESEGDVIGTQSVERNPSASHQVEKPGKEKIKNWRTVNDKSVQK